MVKKQQMNTSITALAAIEYLKRLEKFIMLHYDYLDNCIDYNKLQDYTANDIDSLEACLSMVVGVLLEVDIHSTRARKRLEKL